MCVSVYWTGVEAFSKANEAHPRWLSTAKLFAQEIQSNTIPPPFLPLITIDHNHPSLQPHMWKAVFRPGAHQLMTNFQVE